MTLRARSRASRACSCNIRRAICNSALAFLSPGSHATASSKSLAAFPQTFSLAKANPRRSVAFACCGSNRKASVQSPITSRHSSSFNRAAARFASNVVFSRLASVSSPALSAAPPPPSTPAPAGDPEEDAADGSSDGSYFSNKSSAPV
eukprot:CAMPEP_0198513654 /NCGR_PEP_ID=MMETSP1462-20131121/16197_1 /TAXON_ID=1333877 /ORGANISM="Brandtodinium nutriculum, Strain RCC3387" /LENGTH=147 /DNA_ID=CAMNT_0044243079 /DNA_START=12 /DNA_END=455 /DNA_ORIENTATION=+